MSLSMMWPILLGLGSEILYQICAKSTPAKIHPLASLSVTYVIGAAVSAIMYFVLNREGNLMHELSNINWATVALGFSIVGLELGAIYMYQVGWSVSTGPLVKNVCVIITLTFVGLLFYHETITLSKAVGIVLCLIGFVFINK